MATDYRKVYLNFQDGNGYRDISHLVLFNSLSIQRRAFNDSYKFAQNEIAFNILYDANILALIEATILPIFVRVTDVREGIDLTTEDGYSIGTEDGRHLVIDQDVFIPLFQGHLQTSLTRTYNGYDTNTVINLSGTDLLDLLDQPVGDIVLANYKICDPSNTSASIVHHLIGIAGWPSYIVDPLSIVGVSIDRFAPTTADSSILDTLTTLLYEYGYVLNMNSAGFLTLIKWFYEADTEYVFEFNNHNIVNRVEVSDDRSSFDGIDVVYYDLKSADDVLLYMDDSCGYADDSTFHGYNVLGGYSYPPETNVIDETTSQPTIVYQEYEEKGIKYRTNKAIVNHLDYYRDAFSSDFSAIVATENQYLSARYDTGIVISLQEFYNKKCRLVYRNTTANDELKLFYNNVYGTMWYKSSERTSAIDLVVSPNSIFKYTSSFLYAKTHADKLAKVLASQYKTRRTQYKFTSSEDITEGAIVKIVLDDGTNQFCVILESSYSETTELYSYVLMRIGLDHAVISLTSQTNHVVATIDPNYTYPVVTGAVVETHVAGGASKYLGTVAIVPTTSSVTIVKGPSVGENIARINDWVLMSVSGTTWTIGVCYMWIGTEWVELSHTAYVVQYQSALYDMLSIPGLITDTGYFGALFAKVLITQTACIEELQTKIIHLQSGGTIYGGERFDVSGAEVDTSADGWWLGPDGKLKANLQSLFRRNVLIGTDAGLHLEDSAYGEGNTVVGDKAGMGVAGTTYSGSTIVGTYAGKVNRGTGNTFLGWNAGGYNSTGNSNCFVGYNAGAFNTTGYQNSYFGDGAGAYSTGYGNTFIGYGAGGANAFSNCTILGFADVTGNNQVQLNAYATTVYAYGAIQDRSDARDKADIIPESLGLNFINALIHVQFRWDMREAYRIPNGDGTYMELVKDGSKKRNRYHNGFIAQDVKNVMDTLGVDFGGYQDHSIKGGYDVLSLGYEEFIAPMCKAIQELNDKIEMLENRSKENIE